MPARFLVGFIFLAKSPCVLSGCSQTHLPCLYRSEGGSTYLIPNIHPYLLSPTIRFPEFWFPRSLLGVAYCVESLSVIESMTWANFTVESTITVRYPSIDISNYWSILYTQTTFNKMDLYLFASFFVGIGHFVWSYSLNIEMNLKWVTSITID